MSLYRDRQIRGFCFFLIFFMSLMLCTGLIFGVSQTGRVRTMYHMRDEAVASSLLEQGVSKEVVAAALTNTERNEAGRALIAAAGFGRQTETRLLPFSVNSGSLRFVRRFLPRHFSPWYLLPVRFFSFGKESGCICRLIRRWPVISTEITPAICRRTERARSFKSFPLWNSLRRCCGQKGKRSIRPGNF